MHTHTHTHTYAFWSSSSLPMWWLILFSTPTLEPIMSSWSSCACISSWRQNNKQSHQHSVSSTHNAVHQEQQKCCLLVSMYIHWTHWAWSLGICPAEDRATNKATVLNFQHGDMGVYTVQLVTPKLQQHLRQNIKPSASEAEHQTISIWRQNIKPSASEGRTSNHQHLKAEH